METTTTGTQKQSIERASQSAHAAVDRAAQAASQAAERIGSKTDELMAMKEDWVAGAREYVREHPMAALGIALAAGYVLSMLTRSR
ncbi:MAG TPA: hypothetical protein VML57_17385 [Burkholderiales bacterium]|jgi:ElaB/YqjD/DUF883 family membrane-anchored ribosome-binding protein|nr:hypothetical protein [Burkholderiales bacterium]